MKCNKMKNAMLGLAIAGCFCALAQEATTKITDAQKDEAANTLAFINQMNYAYVVMKTYHNPIAVQEQYERIALDRIDVTSIPRMSFGDTSIKQLIFDMQSVLHELAVAEKDLDYFRKSQEELARRKKKEMWVNIITSVPNALKNAGDLVQATYGLKGAGAGATGNADPLKHYVTAFNALLVLSGDVIGGPVKSVVDYQEELEKLRAANSEHQFKYDMSKEETAYDTNQKLLKAEMVFADKYGFSRKQIVSPDELVRLTEVLKFGDQSVVFKHLVKPDMRAHFAEFAPYWYYLGLSALASKEFAVSAEACLEFRKRNRGLMKTDPMIAQAASIEATALVGLGCKDKERIEKLLKLVEDGNFDGANVDQSYLCAEIAYRYLDQPERALSILDCSIGRMQNAYVQRLVSYRNLYLKAENHEWSEVPSDIDLLRARSLYREILESKKNGELLAKLQDVVADDTTSSLEKLFHCGAVTTDILWNEAKRDVMAIGLWYFRDSRRFWVEIPVSWFILGDVKPSLRLMQGEKEIQVVAEGPEKRKIRANSQGVGSDVVSIPFKYEGEFCHIDSVVFDFPHVSWPIKITYRPSGAYDVGEGKWESDCLAFEPYVIDFMGTRKELAVQGEAVAANIRAGRMKGYSDYLTPFKFGETTYKTNFLTSLKICEDRKFVVAYTNPTPLQTSIKLDATYFNKFGAKICHVEDEKTIGPQSGGEWVLEWPSDMVENGLPELLYFQYHVDDDVWDWCKNSSRATGNWAKSNYSRAKGAIRRWMKK